MTTKTPKRGEGSEYWLRLARQHEIKALQAQADEHNKKFICEARSPNLNITMLGQGSSLIGDLKEKFTNWRYKKCGVYTFDRIIFNGAIFLVFLYCFLVMYSYDFNFSGQYYFKCENPSGCTNPFYQGINKDLNEDYRLTEKQIKMCKFEWCKDKFLPYGEYGQKPTPLFNNASWFAFLIVIIAFLLNHFWHNKHTINIEEEAKD